MVRRLFSSNFTRTTRQRECGGTGVSVALFTAETFEPVVSGWTVVLEGLTCLFDAVVGQLAQTGGVAFDFEQARDKAAKRTF